MDEESFLETIRRSPDDRTIRLAYADWLEERGDGRAELLRVDHELSQASPKTGLWRRLRTQRDRLRKGCDPAWLKTALRVPLGEIGRWFRENPRDNDPEGPARLADIEQLEGCVGVLPEALRAFLLEVQDGISLSRCWVKSAVQMLAETDWELARQPFVAPASVAALPQDAYEALPGTLSFGEPGEAPFIVLNGPHRGEIWNWEEEFRWPVIQYEISSASSPEECDARLQSLCSQRVDFIQWLALELEEFWWEQSQEECPPDELFDVDPQLENVWVQGRPLPRLPQPLRKLTALKQLTLNYTETVELPEWVDELVSLREARFAYGQLETLPAGIGKLPNLVALSATGNRINKLPDTIGGLACLERFDLRGNALRDLPASFVDLSHLNTLDLSYNRIHLLPEAIGRLPSLETLILDGNSDLDLSDVLTKLAACRSLRRLSLCDCRLRELPPQIGLLSQLEHLNLRSNYLIALPDAVRNLPNLREFVVEQNPRTQRLYQQREALLPNFTAPTHQRYDAEADRRESFQASPSGWIASHTTENPMSVMVAIGGFTFVLMLFLLLVEYVTGVDLFKRNQHQNQPRRSPFERRQRVESSPRGHDYSGKAPWTNNPS